MPTLYDNFSQVRQYIDENAGHVDLSSYVTKTELASMSYATTSDLNSYLNVSNLPKKEGVSSVQLRSEGLTYDINGRIYPNWLSYSESSSTTYNYSFASVGTIKNFVNGRIQAIESTYVTSTALEGMSYATTSQLPVINESIIPKENSTYTLGGSNYRFASTYTDRLYVTANNYTRDVNSNGWYFSRNNTDIFKVMAGAGNIGINPVTNGDKYLGSNGLQWGYTYTKNLILDGTDISNTLSSINSTGKIHYGTAVHDRTSYTTTCTVDTFDTDSNGNPLVGTTICVKLTSVSGTNPATLYPVKFIVNGKENPRYYEKAVVSSNGRNWYRDMTDGVGGYWYWTFDGTNWIWMNVSREANTEYSSMTDAEASAGTGTTGRLIKPVTLATYYTPKSAFVYDSTTYTLTITV